MPSLLKPGLWFPSKFSQRHSSVNGRVQQCEAGPCVKRVVKETAAQHSVHLTGGYAPRFQAFSWLRRDLDLRRYLVSPASR